MLTVSEVATTLGIDITSDSTKLEKKSGAFILRREYFWCPTSTPQEYFYHSLAKLQAAYGGSNVVVIEYGNKWNSFKGGGTAKQNAHYFFKFKIKEGKNGYRN